MKNLKSLNKKILFIVFILFSSFKSHSSDKPIDIWKANEEKNIQNSETSLSIDQDNDSPKEISIYKKESIDETSSIFQDTSLDSKMTKIIGLYDPNDYDLDINMWSNSDGDQLKDLFGRIAKLLMLSTLIESLKFTPPSDDFNKNIPSFSSSKQI